MDGVDVFPELAIWVKAVLDLVGKSCFVLTGLPHILRDVHSCVIAQRDPVTPFFPRSILRFHSIKADSIVKCNNCLFLNVALEEQSFTKANSSKYISYETCVYIDDLPKQMGRLMARNTDLTPE